MAKYFVTLQWEHVDSDWQEIEVEADSLEEAEDIALGEMDDVDGRWFVTDSQEVEEEEKDA